MLGAAVLLDWDSMARRFYAPVVDFTWLPWISNDLMQFLVVWTCLKIKWKVICAPLNPNPEELRLQAPPPLKDDTR